MPTRAQLERLYGYNDVPMYDPPQRSSSLLDLTMAQGQQRADAALRSGELWSNTINSIGQGLGNYFQQKDEQKKLRKRDEAWVGFIGRSDWTKNPEQAYAETLRIWGPDEGPRQFQALVGVSQLMQPKRDQAADSKALGAIGGAMSKMDDAGRAALWPQAVALTKNAFPHVELPQQYDPQVWTRVQPLFAQLSGEKAPEGFTLRPGEQRFDASGAQVAAVPPEVKEQPGFSLGPGEVRYDASGRPIASRPAAPQEPKQPTLKEIETVGPDGKPITMFVEAKAGATYPKPTGQGKPATGQQRRALNFFNRGKEAGEIADRLEGNVAKYNLANQGRLAYEGPFSNFLKSEEQQQYRQAQRAFTEARLRKDSGAAIPEQEFENDAKTYFAQPGDTAATIAQKRSQRLAILRSIAMESGDALREFYGEEADALLQTYGGPGSRGPKKIATEADYNALPSGAEYVDPNGVRRRKR